jgi:hypothetical protein
VVRPGLELALLVGPLLVALHHWCFYCIPISIKQEKKRTVAPLMRIVYGVRMDTDSDPIIRKSVSARASLWKRIDDYQIDNRVKRDSDAIRQLLELGLEAAKQRKKEKA